MEDNIYRESVIKFNWHYDTYYYGNFWKLKDTNLPLDGIYEDGEGTIRYFKNGKLHNENGPVVIRKNGTVIYYINNKIDRIDGPAIIYSNGNYEWWINDYNIGNETMNNWLRENDISLDWNIWTDSDKMMFALHWSDYTE